MINVSTQLKKESLTNRNYYVTANVTLSNGTTLKLGKKDFYLSGNSLVDSADSGDFPVGVAIENTASLSLVIDDMIVINPGSICLPRGHYHFPTYCIYDTKTKKVTFYNIKTHQPCNPFNK